MAPQDETLEQLAGRAARGDRSALRAIYERTAARLFREVIAPVLPDRAAAEDALKETFVAAMEHLPALGRGEVLPWLATIARNKALDRRRRMSAEGRFRERLAAELASQEAALPDPESAAASSEARRLARERVEAALARMNPRYATAVRLRLLEERSREDCAAQLGVSVGTFDVLLFRACKQFRACCVDPNGKVEAV